MGAERDVLKTDRILAPAAGLIAGKPCGAQGRFRNLRTVIIPQVENRLSGAAAERYSAVALGAAVSRSEIGGEKGIEVCGLRWKQERQGVVGSLGDGSVERDGSLRRRDSGITLISAENRVHRIEHRDVDNSHGPSRATRSELLAKRAKLSGRDRGVIESARVNGDLVPAMNRIECFLRGLVSDCGRRSGDSRAEIIARAGCAGVQSDGQAERKKDCGRQFHTDREWSGLTGR